jgi:hypothetical protein
MPGRLVKCFRHASTFCAGLIGDRSKYPFEFEKNGFRDEQAAVFDQAARKICLVGVVLQVVPGKNIGINRAHAALPFLPRLCPAGR